MRKTLLCGALSALALATPALAQEAEEAPICTDRPTKANATCTVLAGKFQLETTVVGWGRIESGGAKTDVWQVGSSFVKLGLTDRIWKSTSRLILTSGPRLTAPHPTPPASATSPSATSTA